MLKWCGELKVLIRWSGAEVCGREHPCMCNGWISGGNDKWRGGMKNESRLVHTQNSACKSNIPQLDTKYHCWEICQSVTQFTMAEHGQKQTDQAYHSSPTWIYTQLGLLIVLRSLFIFITPIILSLDLISWSYPFSGSRLFHGLLLITPISFTLFITCRSLSFTSVSPLFHFHLWCPITFYA